MTVPVGVLASGRGSNFQALLDACAVPGFPARIALLVCNVAGAAALDRAGRAGVPAAVVEHGRFASREAFEAAIEDRLGAAGVELVCLAGFLRLLTRGFTERWQGRLLNIHPSLLPLFKGLHTHRRALEAGVKLHGCTVHFVSADLDSGPIIAQAAVPVAEDDDEDSLAARVLEAEHRLYPEALRLVAAGRTRLDGQRVRILPQPPTGR